MRLAIAFDAILRSTLSSFIGLQFERSKSDLSYFGTKIMIPLRCEMESSPFSCASLNLLLNRFLKVVVNSFQPALESLSRCA